LDPHFGTAGGGILRDLIRHGDYQEYLEANADSADQLAQLISDFVNYGRTKDRQERPTNRLEIPNP
jgi:hypothetical protein